MTTAALKPDRRRSYGRAVVVSCMLAIVAAWGVWMWAASATDQKVRERTAHWTSVVEAHVAIGEPRTDAEQWVRQTFAVEEAQPGRRDNGALLVAEAERVEVVGPRFPCGGWVILVEIHFGPDGKVISRGVTRGGEACL